MSHADRISAQRKSPASIAGIRPEWAATAQIALIALWHIAATVLLPILFQIAQTRAKFYVPGMRGFTREGGERFLAGLRHWGDWPWLLQTWALESAAIYAGLRFLAGASARDFPRLWWKSCLRLTFPAAIATAVLGSIPYASADFDAVIAISGFLLLAISPTLIARGEAQQRRMIRWRPECPECGYSVRRSADRCPECGEAYPTSSCVYRRWAIQRATWDRRNRGWWPAAHLGLARDIVLMPWRTAWRMSIPDRMRRAMYWALLHVAGTAVIICSVGRELAIIPTILAYFFERRTPRIPPELMPPIPPGSVVALWTIQRIAEWFVVLAATVLTGVAASYLVSTGNRAARLSLVKWSLYSSVALGAVLMLWYVFDYGTWWSALPVGARRVAWDWKRVMVEFNPPPVEFFALVYGLIWAAGAASNPWRRQRGVGAFFALATLYVTMWFLAAFVAFSPGALTALL